MKKLLALVFAAGLAFVGCGDDRDKETYPKRHKSKKKSC